MNDRSIGANEKLMLVSVSEMLVQNYQGIVDLTVASASKNKNLNNARTNCWLCELWNVIVSIVVTIIVTALVVASVITGIGIALDIVITSEILAASLVVGAVIGAVWATYDAVVNDTCYYAGQCDTEYAGTQSCSTGRCLQA